jgi:hypothetical protein
MDIGQLIYQLTVDGAIDGIARNQTAQFGTSARSYLGATVLPERLVTLNAYREDSIKYRTIVANHSTRYSPPQKKGGALIGSFLVELGEQDIASEFSAREYDMLLEYLKNGATMDAMFSLTNWLDITINRALIELNEKDRWDCIVDAAVVRQGDNKYEETVNYSDPSGHRAAAAAAWSTDTTDIMDEIWSYVDMLATKGFTVGRIISSRNVVSIMAGNDTIKSRAGKITISGGSIVATTGKTDLSAINGIMAEDGLPPIELYDLQYRTQVGTARFMPNDVFIMLCTTGRDEALDRGDVIEIVPDTIGYHAIGRPAGQSGPGRVIRAEAFTNKPPRVEAEGWQTSLPVITEPEAIVVIHTIT